MYPMRYFLYKTFSYVHLIILTGQRLAVVELSGPGRFLEKKN